MHQEADKTLMRCNRSAPAGWQLHHGWHRCAEICFYKYLLLIRVTKGLEPITGQRAEHIRYVTVTQSFTPATNQNQLTCREHKLLCSRWRAQSGTGGRGSSARLCQTAGTSGVLSPVLKQRSDPQKPGLLNEDALIEVYMIPNALSHLITSINIY